MGKCEHCKVDTDDFVPKDTFKKRLGEKDEKIGDLTAEIKAKGALIEQAEGKVKAAQAKITELEPLRERVEAIERTEQLVSAGIAADKLADGKVSKRVKREYDAYAADSKDAGTEPKTFADWLAADDGARADVLLAPLFAAKASGEPAEAAPKAQAPTAPLNGKPAPKPATGPPAAPPASAPTPGVLRTASDVAADPTYQAAYQAAQAAKRSGNAAAVAEHSAKARARLEELRQISSQPIAT